jgi:CBS-domain-containing membrane protein
MPRTCTVCGNESREEIDRALVAGDAYRNIAERYGTSTTALHRHKADHLPVTLTKAKEAGEVARADELLSRVESLQTRTLAVLEAAEETGELRTALSAIREARSNLELLAKLVGELDERPKVNVVLIDAQVRDAIVRALAPYGEARLAVANALEPFEDAS